MRRSTLSRPVLTTVAALLLAQTAAAQALLYEKMGTPLDHHYGRSVSMLGDVDQDGFGDFIVTSPEAKNGVGLAVGRYVVFSGKNGAGLHSSSGWQDGGKLGYSARGTGDVDQDGYPDFAVGWPGQNGMGLLTLHSGKTGATPAR